jgi:hypothetical protein
MTSNKKEDCKKQLKAITKTNQPFLDKGWVPLSHEGAVFYRFIPAGMYNSKSDRIDRGAFEDAGFSVLAAGPCLQNIDIQQKLKEKNINSSKTKYVGAVKIDATIFSSKQYGEFQIHHDPHPYMHGEQSITQDPNHFSVVCVKPEELVDNFIEEPDWAVGPEEIS